MKNIANIISVVCILIGISLIGLFSYVFLNEYAPFTFKKSEAEVGYKVSEIGLHYFPKYEMVVVDKENYVNTSLLKVSKKEMNEYEVGDTIRCLEINGNHFTWKQFFLDAVYALLFIIAGFFFLLFGVLLNRKGSRLDDKLGNGWRLLKRYKEKMAGSWKYILLFIGIIVIFGDNIWHFFNIHLHPYEETVATIEEMEEQPGYGRYTGPTFRFHLTYDVKGEPRRAHIKVTKSHYDRYFEGNSITIYYQRENPYYVFLPSELKFGQHH